MASIIKHPIYVDITKSIDKICAVVQQFDHLSRQLNITVIDAAKPFDMSGYDISLEYMLPDGTGYTAGGQYISVSGSNVIITINNHMTSQVGVVYFKLKFRNDTLLHSTEFKVKVEQGIITQDEISAVQFETEFDELKEYVTTFAADSEAYALGTRNGDDVQDDDVAYKNNAKYYAETIKNMRVTTTTVASDKQASASTSIVDDELNVKLSIPKGKEATVSVGNVTKGDVAKVTNSGTASDAVLDFVLPKGDTGAPAGFGKTTITVNSIPSNVQSSGTVTASGDDKQKDFDFVLNIPRSTRGTLTVGSVTKGEEPSVTNVGTAEDATLNFVLPKGDQGIKGDAATVGVNGVTMIDSTATPSVENTGDEHDAVLHFNIPKPTGINGIAFNAEKSGHEVAGKAGLTDIYTITCSDNTQYDITVVNGINGNGGGGDMVAAQYDVDGDGVIDVAYNTLYLGGIAANQYSLDDCGNWDEVQ